MSDNRFSAEDRRRYSRNIMLKGIGVEGQHLLNQSTVTVVGAGALGSISAMYLAASGIGKIRIIDFDTIDISNLQRQLSFTEKNLGEKKVDATKQRLMSINSNVCVETIDRLITKSDAEKILLGSDIVIEGSDNPETKYLVADVCERIKTPYVLGGVSEFQGQVTSWENGYHGYRDLFPDMAAQGSFMPCSLGGVLGPLPGIVGSIQASEVIKILCKTGAPLFGKLLLIDALDMRFTVVRY